MLHGSASEVTSRTPNQILAAVWCQKFDFRQRPCVSAAEIRTHRMLHCLQGSKLLLNADCVVAKVSTRTKSPSDEDRAKISTSTGRWAASQNEHNACTVLPGQWCQHHCMNLLLYKQPWLVTEMYWLLCLGRYTVWIADLHMDYYTACRRCQIEIMPRNKFNPASACNHSYTHWEFARHHDHIDPRWRSWLSTDLLQCASTLCSFI